MSSTLQRRQYQNTDPVEVDSLDGYHTFGLNLQNDHPVEVVSMEYRPSPDTRPQKYSSRRTYFLIAAFVSDFIILSILGTVEYFLRWSTFFPFRMRKFRCDDQQLNITVDNANEFPPGANIPSPVIYSLSLCAPVLLILFTELVIWLSVGPRKPDIHLKLRCCPKVTLFQNVRRMDRYVVSQLFGAFATMIFVDVLKNLLGIQRPNFLSTCKPRCESFGTRLQIKDCTVNTPSILRDISTSFPSIQSALSMHAAVSITLYLSGVARLHHSKYMLKPLFCLSCVLLAFACGALKVAAGQNWWADVVAGQAIGASIALYMGVVVMRKYDLQLYISNRKLMDQIIALETRLMTLRLSNKESFSPPQAFEMNDINRGRHRKMPSSGPKVEYVSQEFPMPNHHPQFNEFSNTFREELKRTLNATSQRAAEPTEEDEPEDVFY